MLVAIIFLTLFAIFLFVLCIGLAAQNENLKQQILDVDAAVREEAEILERIDKAFGVLWERIENVEDSKSNIVSMYPQKDNN